MFCKREENKYVINVAGGEQEFFFLNKKNEKKIKERSTYLKDNEKV